FLRARPPDTEHLVPRVPGLRRGFERDGAHHAVGPDDHVVGLRLPDLQPLRFLRLPGRRHGNLERFEAELRRHRVEYRDRLLAVRRLVIEEPDLLALELLEPALLLPEV